MISRMKIYVGPPNIFADSPTPLRFITVKRATPPRQSGILYWSSAGTADVKASAADETLTDTVRTYAMISVADDKSDNVIPKFSLVTR
jgi:hypothetical protein